MPRKTKENSKKRKINKKTNINEKEVKNTKDDKFSFDEEIVIGLKKIEEPKVDNKKNKKSKKKAIKKTKKNQINKSKSAKNQSKDENEIIIKSKYMDNYEEKNGNDNNRVNKKRKYEKKSKPITKKQQEIIKKRKAITRIVRWITLILIILGGIIYAMLSPIFNIKNITVLGNSKISSDTIISLSGLNIDQNIFNFRTSKIINEIKQNAYIDKVEISRKLPDTVDIRVYEREVTFMLDFGNAYTYINNQGYILEITGQSKDIPTIEGYKTPKEDIQVGNRLCTEDLEKLEDILKIMEAAGSIDKEISGAITKINIEDKSNYILTLEKEKKTVYLGDISDLSTKMLWIKEFLSSEKNTEGIIYLNVNLNNERPYFREKI